MKMKEKLKSNKGFSLVEILIAMAVLAIIIIPSMRLFSGSFNMNITSKRRMNANVVAEDLMEAIKVNDLEHLTFKFNFPDYVPATADDEYSGFDLIRNAMIPSIDDTYIYQLKKTGTSSYDKLAPGDAGSSLEATGAGTFSDFVPSADGKYYYYINSITNNGTKEKYDALITVDASDYRAGGSAVQKYNAQELVDVDTVNGSGSASFMQSSSNDTNLLATLQEIGSRDNGATYPTLTEDNLYRKFELFVVNAGGLNTCRIQYTYTAKAFGFPDVAITDQSELYSGNAVNDPLKDLFFFYSPNYYSKAGDVHDEIYIENKNDLPLNVYLVKQEGAPSTTVLQVDEQLYKVNVSVQEASFKTESITRIRTNIDYNLAASTIETLDPNVNQGNFSYNASSGMKSRLVTDLANTKSKDRYFDVDIKIYASDDVSSLTFPGNEDIIYELKGSTQE